MATNPDPQLLALRIRAAAALQGLRTDAQIGELIGMSPWTIRRRMSGKPQFTWAQVVQLAAKLDTTAGKLMDGEDAQTPAAPAVPVAATRA